MLPLKVAVYSFVGQMGMNCFPSLVHVYSLTDPLPHPPTRRRSWYSHRRLIQLRSLLSRISPYESVTNDNENDAGQLGLISLAFEVGPLPPPPLYAKLS